MQCTVARVYVRAKSIMKSVGDVRACCSFWACDAQSLFAHFLEQNGQKLAYFCLRNCFRTSFFVLEHPFLL